jgi:hypothetical protein
VVFMGSPPYKMAPLGKIVTRKKTFSLGLTKRKT